jgi:DeoR/GlpR family transcriptional regulator of sugar metabolism
MLPRQRQAMILEEIRRRSGVRVSDLAEVLQVSPMTVRRDLARLHDRGLLQKVHGGATLATTPMRREPVFEARALERRREKQAIAQQAVGLAQPGATVGLTGGTTTWYLAQYLAAVPDVTVVTNSPRAAEVMWRAARPDQTVVLTGGVQDTSGALVGPLGEQALARLHVDVLFVGCHGFHVRTGLTCAGLAEGNLNRAFVGIATTVVLVADHSKWGLAGLSAFASLDEVDVCVTDAGADWEVRGLLAEAVGELLVAPVAEPEPVATG